MALSRVIDSTGKPVIIWSGDIAPSPRPAIALGEWPDVWARVDASSEGPKINADPAGHELP